MRKFHKVLADREICIFLFHELVQVGFKSLLVEDSHSPEQGTLVEKVKMLVRFLATNRFSLSFEVLLLSGIIFAYYFFKLSHSLKRFRRA